MAPPPPSADVPAPVETSRLTPDWLSSVGVVIGLGLLVLVSSLAIGATTTSMAERGVGVEELQSAGTPATAEQAYRELGEEGRPTAWWFLAFELPFLTSFGLLLSAGCAFAARQLAAAGAERLARIARFAVLFGLLAAASDLIQNAAVVPILNGDFGQPAPRLGQVFGYLTWAFGISAGFVFVAGWIVAALRSR